LWKEGLSTRPAEAGQVTASSVLILPIMLILEPPWTLAALPTATIRAALAVLSTALAYILHFRLLAACGATTCCS